jgi:hypothetical protein
MTTERTVNRNQKAEYISGSHAKGSYTFEIQGVERVNKIHVQRFGFEGTAATSEEAKRLAWASARAWVAEAGEVVKSDSEYKSTKD